MGSLKRESGSAIRGLMGVDYDPRPDVFQKTLQLKIEKEFT
jgi:hypothetical protein